MQQKVFDPRYCKQNPGFWFCNKQKHRTTWLQKLVTSEQTWLILEQQEYEEKQRMCNSTPRLFQTKSRICVIAKIVLQPIMPYNL